MVHIYKPGAWAASIGATASTDRCREAVHEGGRGVGFHQCGRKPAVTREVDGKEYGFCKQHDPVVVKAKDAARRERWDAEAAARSAKWDREARQRAALPLLLEAMKTIAAGHNDARAFAAETLAKVGDV